MYYAAIERKREAEDPRPIPDASWTIAFKTLTGRRSKIVWGNEEYLVQPNSETVNAPIGSGLDSEKEKVEASVSDGSPTMVTSEEQDRLYRALRVASWQAVFYLITTDILGFTNASATFQEMGYGAGVLTYTFFYLLAVGAGQIIWKMYLAMDSSKFPVVCYADLGERTFGRFIRHLFNVFQSLQYVPNSHLCRVTVLSRV
jgi:hypothetical protein